jgi:hypothetical protein
MEERLLTNPGHRTYGLDILNTLLGLDLQAHDDRLVRGPNISRNVDSVGNSREWRALPSEAVRWEFGAGHDALRACGGVYLGHDEAAGEILSSAAAEH